MRASILLLCSAALVLAACAGEPPTIPQRSATADLQGQGFRLTLDLRAGRVTNGGSASGSSSIRNASALRPSLSLLGSDAIDLESSSGIVTCTTLPKSNPTQKRCTFALAITNKLHFTDLMPPTDFPRPPQGTNGILVFPFSATSDGTGGWAVPSPDWDMAPANFFNDTGSCSNGSKTDCYRYEVIPAPIYHGTLGSLPQVGFDVPADAQTVTVNIVVAADLRDNPNVTFTAPAIRQLCGLVQSSGFVARDTGIIKVAELDPATGARSLGFCAFDNALPKVPLEILSAHIGFQPFVDFGHFYVEPLDYGPSLDVADYDLPSPPASSVSLSFCCVIGGLTSNNVTSAVQSAVDQGLPRIAFRMMPYQSEVVGLGGTNQPQQKPKLEITYRLR